MKQITTRLLLCVSLWLLVSTMHAAAYAQNPAEDERLFKAAFIYNFAKFTRWPENVWKENDLPLVLCTAGQDILVTDLKRLAGKIIKRRRVTIQPLKDTHPPTNCHVLYIAISEKEHYRSILEGLRGQPVLTVSELPDFGRTGGIIELYREKGQTHFIIDLGMAQEAGLTFSSRLLRMAMIVGHEDEP